MTQPVFTVVLSFTVAQPWKFLWFETVQSVSVNIKKTLPKSEITVSTFELGMSSVSAALGYFLGNQWEADHEQIFFFFCLLNFQFINQL